MLSVYKYQVPLADTFSLALPQGAIPFCMKEQRGLLMLWCLVDPDMPGWCRAFRLSGTGHTIEQSADQLKYIDSVSLNNGELVFHLFEIVA
jgi:hypothetical protein